MYSGRKIIIKEEKSSTHKYLGERVREDWAIDVRILPAVNAEIHQIKEVKDTVQSTKITTSKSENYFQNLYSQSKIIQTQEGIVAETNKRNPIAIEQSEA